MTAPRPLAMAQHIWACYGAISTNGFAGSFVLRTVFTNLNIYRLRRLPVAKLFWVSRVSKPKMSRVSRVRDIGGGSTTGFGNAPPGLFFRYSV